MTHDNGRRSLGSLSPAGWVLGLLVLVLVAAGSATAGALVTGKQIKNNSVTTKDIKNRSLKLKDVKRSELEKLRGQSVHPAVEALPSGTVAQGGGYLNDYVPAAGSQVRYYVPLPFVTTIPLVDTGANRNLFSGAGGGFSAGHVDASRCSGGLAAPTAAPGTLCVYAEGAANVSTAQLIAGVDDFTADPADDNGFYVNATSSGAGEMRLRFVWVYRAP